jgi:translation initiation factor IF-1
MILKMILNCIIKKIEDNKNLYFKYIISKMVKNSGGNKSKKIGRKFITASSDNKIRLSQEEAEIYAVVTKNLGNGMFYANDSTGKELLCIMRRKFKGRSKRDNVVSPGGWVLVGKREFESCAKPKYDLLEVYNENEKQKLKNTGDPIFSKLKNENDNYDDIIDTGFIFDNDDTDKYDDILAQLNEANSTKANSNKANSNKANSNKADSTIKTIIDDDDDEVIGDDDI